MCVKHLNCAWHVISGFFKKIVYQTFEEKLFTKHFKNCLPNI